MATAEAMDSKVRNGLVKKSSYHEENIFINVYVPEATPPSQARDKHLYVYHRQHTVAVNEAFDSTNCVKEKTSSS
jgi:hypothetical protein